MESIVILRGVLNMEIRSIASHVLEGLRDLEELLSTGVWDWNVYRRFVLWEYIRVLDEEEGFTQTYFKRLRSKLISIPFLDSHVL